MNLPVPPADPEPARDGKASRAWAMAALVTLFGLNLRATLGSIPPLLGHIAADLGLGSSALGLLLSTCVLAMGAFAPTGHLLAARVGTERALTLLLATLGVSEVVRVAAYHPVVLYASVALAGATMGAASTLMPGFIAHHVPRGRGLTMGIYSTGLALGVALAAGTAVPLERLLGGWRPALAAVGVLSLATAVVSWVVEKPLLRTMPEQVGGPHRARDPLPWHSPPARWLTLLNALAMAIGFSGLAWVAPYYVDLGMSVQDAAGMVVLYQVVQLVAMLALPGITDVTSDRRPLVGGMLLATLVGTGLLGLAPMVQPLLAVGLFGLGAGGIATLLLVLSVDLTDSRPAASALNAMTMLVGYGVGAAGPFLLGAARDVTGSLGPGYLVVSGLVVVGLLIVPVFRPGLTVARATAGDGQSRDV